MCGCVCAGHKCRLQPHFHNSCEHHTRNQSQRYDKHAHHRSFQALHALVGCEVAWEDKSAACLHGPQKSLVLTDQDVATSTYTSHANFTGTGPSPLGAHRARTDSWTLTKSKKTLVHTYSSAKTRKLHFLGASSRRRMPRLRAPSAKETKSDCFKTQLSQMLNAWRPCNHRARRPTGAALMGRAGPQPLHPLCLVGWTRAEHWRARLMRAQVRQGPVLSDRKQTWGGGNWLSLTRTRALYARRTSSQYLRAS